MTIEIKVLGSGDGAVLANVADGVFDYEIDPCRSVEFLNDPRHHIAVAIDAGVVVGFASAVHYVHPDKNPELWINEVGVALTHRKQGVAAKLLQALFKVGRGVGCVESWVLTDQSNSAAMRLYASQGGIPKNQVMFAFHLGNNAIKGEAEPTEYTVTIPKDRNEPEIADTSTNAIERVRGQYIGRNRSSAYKDLVFTVATANNIDADITSQTEQTLVTIENNLCELGSHKYNILSAQVYMANILEKHKMDAVWCQWLGPNPQHWPQRACLGVALEGKTLIEISVTAVR